MICSVEHAFREQEEGHARGQKQHTTRRRRLLGDNPGGKDRHATSPPWASARFSSASRDSPNGAIGRRS